MKFIELTERDLHRIVDKTVSKVLKEGVYDPDDDNEIYDVGDGGKYRVSWEFKTPGRTTYEINTASEGREEMNSREEAIELFSKLKEEYKGTFATLFRIERLVKTLADDRWETEYDASNQYVRSVSLPK